MNALLVVAHPSNTSFTHAMAATACEVLQIEGYKIQMHDLYAEDFDPIQRRSEAGNSVSQDPLVEQHCSELENADLVLIFHPNWWSQPPAILKGWVDRVFRLGTAYKYPDDVSFDGVPTGTLVARHALIFNTSNTPVKREIEVFGDPLENLWRNSIFALCGVHSVQRRMFGPMAYSTKEQRNDWLKEVAEIVRNVASQETPDN